MSPVGSPAFGPAGQQASPPDGSQLLQVTGEQGPVFPPLPGAVLMTGEPLPNDYYNPGLGTYSPSTEGYLYLTRIPVVAPHLSHIGFDPALNYGAYLGKNRIGIYRSVHGQPTELVEEIGVIDSATFDNTDPAKAFLATDFHGSEGEVYWAGWTWQGGETYPNVWMAAGYPTVGFPWVPTAMDPDQAGESGTRYYDWSQHAGYPEADSWQQALYDSDVFYEEFQSGGVLNTGWIYRPRNSAGHYGVHGALPETLPALVSVSYDEADGEYYGFAPDGGNSGFPEYNYRLLIRLAT